MMTAEQHYIFDLIERGARFSRVEDLIEASSDLSDNQRAALWLYGWSEQPRRVQRREARRLVLGP